MVDPLRDLVAELREAGDDEATIEIAAVSLAEGDASTDGLATLLDDAASAVRRAAALALGRRRDPAARTRLEARLADELGTVRRAACEALGTLADPASREPLLRSLTDRLPTVRAAAARALRAFPAPATVTALGDLLEREPARPPREAALESLGDLTSAEASAVWLTLACHVAREDEDDLRHRTARTLADAMTDVDWPTVVATMREVPRSSRPTLAQALEGLRLGPDPERLIRELRHRPPEPELLARFGSNLTRRAQAGELGRAYARERELQAVRDRFQRPGPKSVVLLGPSGVGKTAIVHELAHRLAEAETLVPVTLIEATTGEVLSGTRYLGEWQTRLKELVEGLQAPTQAVWYVPDINHLIDAGTSEHSQESFASMLAPALERGTLTILGESTPEAFRRGLARVPQFRKLFWTVEVEVPSVEVSRQILGEVADELTRSHAGRVALEVPPGTIDRALDLADEYFTAQVRPGDGVRLLREAVESVAQACPPAPADEVPARVVTPSQLLATLSSLTGVPVRLLDDSVRLDLAEVRRFFADRVLGQDEAVETVVDLISLIKAGLTDPARPLGVLFFAGPTGVGKTELAKALAEFLFGSPERQVRVDLGEFRESHSLRRLVGDPHALDPAARTGLLTAPVRERPFSLVLLDEVEKAHQNVFDLLLPLLDEGRLIDERGQVTDFRRTIVVMTSNVGSDLSEGTDLGFSGTAERDAQSAKVRRAMAKTFRPEFLNRLTKTVVFAPLTLEVMRRLSRREVRRVLSRKGISRRGAIVETDDAVIGILLEEGFSSTFGARHLKRRVEELLLKPLARAILRLDPEDPQPVIRLGVGPDGTLASQIVPRPKEEPDDVEVPAPGRASARIRDPRLGRLVDLDDLEERVLEIAEGVEGLATTLTDQGLRDRKSELLEATCAADFWEDRERAGQILSEVAALERALETPIHLEGAVAKLDRMLDRARRQPGETRALHDLLAKLDDVAHEVELATYTAHCPPGEARGDAFLHLRLVGDAPLPVDPLEAMGRMYRAYLKPKRYGVHVIFEAVRASGRLREAALRIDGPCAFGLLAGEAGLHQWSARAPEPRHGKLSAFVRVAVLPPATESLRAREIKLERRPTQDQEGVLLRKHRQYVVVTHRDTLVAVDGALGSHPDAEEAALAFLAARVAAARASGGEPDPGVVRRYALTHHLVRDLGTDVKLHLDAVQEGRIDPFVLPRIMGPPAGEG